MSTFGPDDLSEWIDLFTDTMVIDQQAGVDEWGNPIIQTQQSIACKITNRGKAGGSDKGAGEQRTQDDLWRVTVVFVQTTPTPSVNEQITLNGDQYTIETVTVYDDDRGKCFEITATSLTEETIP